MKVHFSNLGCKLNQAEIQSYGRQFAARGHHIVNRLEDADLHVVNSCTVTHAAARDSRKAARRAGRLTDNVKTVLTGCYTESDPSEASGLAGVDLIVPNLQKDELVNAVERAFPDLAKSAQPYPVSFAALEVGPARAALKVEDGCNMTCSFCIIPQTRGRQRSRSALEVVAELGELEQLGYREVVITGVQISSYRDGDHRLYDLTKMLLEGTNNTRIRLSSIAPWQFDDRLLELWSSPRLCRHVHLSLQSGCNATLRRMRRPYSSEQFFGLVSKLRDRVPRIAITTDVIAGFPGESSKEFEQSLAFVERCAFARTHVFSFSVRPGTRAAGLPDHVPVADTRKRVQRLRQSSDRAQNAFWQENVDTQAELLIERSADGASRGTTDNYIPVIVDQLLSPGSLQRVRISGVGARGVLGEASAEPSE